jgi:hypothetical protein
LSQKNLTLILCRDLPLYSFCNESLLGSKYDGYAVAAYDEL